MPANRREFRTHFVLQIPSLGKSRAGAAIPRQSTDSIADKSGRIHRKSADFLRNHSRASVISQGTTAGMCLTLSFPVLLPRSPAAGTTAGSRLRNATFSAWYAFLFVARTRRALMPVPKPIYGGAWQRARLGMSAVIAGQK